MAINSNTVLLYLV